MAEARNEPDGMWWALYPEEPTAIKRRRQIGLILSPWKFVREMPITGHPTIVARKLWRHTNSGIETWQNKYA